jgi:hypothetical protein
MQLEKITIVKLEAKERDMLAELRDSLYLICCHTSCAGFSCSDDCPLSAMVNKARDLAEEISKFLANSK